MTGPRVLLADDHATVARGVERVLREHCELVAIVGDGPALLAAAVKLRPDIVIADISMPGFDGLEAVRRMRAAGVESKIIMLSMFPDADLVDAALAAGANGYVVKHSAAGELVKAMREVGAGGVYVTPSVRPL